MEEQVYSYQLKPLVIPGVIYLLIAPVFMAVLYFVVKISTAELSVLRWLYIVTAVAIFALELIQKDPRSEQ